MHIICRNNNNYWDYGWYLNWGKYNSQLHLLYVLNQSLSIQMLQDAVAFEVFKTYFTITYE